MKTHSADPALSDDHKSNEPNVSQIAMRILSRVWLVCLFAQGYLAGLGVMGDASWWLTHRYFGMLFSPLALVLLALAWLGRLPKPLPGLTAVQLLLLGVQMATIAARHLGSPVWLPAFHVANALLMFVVAMAIAGKSSLRRTVS